MHVITPWNSCPPRRSITVVYLLVWFLFCQRAASATKTVVLGWDPNPESEMVAGYATHYGAASGRYTNSVSVTQPEATIPGLEEGVTFFFAVDARNSLDLRSPFSLELRLTIPWSGLRIAVLPTSNGNLRVQFETEPNTEHLLQASSDLAYWQTLATVPPAPESALFEWIEPIDYSQSEPLAAHFFRVVSR